MRRFIRQFWNDFKDFWKTEVFIGLLLSIATLINQWRMGQIPVQDIRANLISTLFPYFIILAGFVVFNVGRTILLQEQRAHRHKRRAERRDEHRSESRQAEAPPPPPPNLQCRRPYQDNVFVGHEISGTAYAAILVEIGNELSQEREVGHAKNVKGHITYLTERSEKLHIVCPARWASQTQSENIAVGESKHLVLSFRKDPFEWVDTLWGGMPMTDCRSIEVRLLTQDGEQLADAMKFDYRNPARVGEKPSFSPHRVGM